MVNCRGAGAGAGLGAPTGLLEEGGAHWARVAFASGCLRAWGSERERSASMHAMDCDGKAANRACECRLQVTGARDDSLYVAVGRARGSKS
eukprot:6209055-Pleurochrysis_carterae.AAC.1